VWRKDLGYILDKYNHWSTYDPGAAGRDDRLRLHVRQHRSPPPRSLAARAGCERGVTNTRLYDVSSTHVSYLISDLFKYSHLVLASVTYNLGIFPPMHNFLMDMKALNLQNRTCAIMWKTAPGPPAPAR
jgi:anaerobic nitric oxide reductase flavorubredoxin